ncbi:MAG: alpha/beta fold hydrolase [Dehalococcoidia bacterium]
MTEVTERFDSTKLAMVDVAGTATRYWAGGEGEPLALFHGGHFASLYSLDAWSLALPLLTTRFRVVAIDKLGQGFTDNPPTPAHYTFDALLDHSIATLDALGIQGAHLAGHSRGALLVAAIALKRPDLVKSLVLVSTNTLAPDDARYPGAAFYQDVERRTPPGPPTRESVRMEPDAQAFDTGQVTDDFVGRLLEVALLPKSLAAKEVMTTASDAIWMPSLAQAKAATLAAIDESGLPCPAIIIWGRNDKSAFLPLAPILFDRIAARTPDCAMHVVNGSGHYVFREQPEAFARAVTSFCLR